MSFLTGHVLYTQTSWCITVLCTGEHCELNIDECLSWPCENEALCLDGIDSYACQCLRGFEGYNCEIDINECESVPCQNEAICVNLVNAYQCQCVPGFVGTYSSLILFVCFV